MNFLEKYKPAVKKRTLLYIAGCAWCIAGSILIARALFALIEIRANLFIELSLGTLVGICFYVFLFTKISKKYIKRISLIEVDRPCFFSFFNVKSYILMIVMISAGIILRKSEIIESDYLYTFYFAMGIPLLLSAFKFFKAAINNAISI